MTYNGNEQELIAAGAVVNTTGVVVEYALSENGPYTTDFPKVAVAVTVASPTLILPLYPTVYSSVGITVVPSASFRFPEGCQRGHLHRLVPHPGDSQLHRRSSPEREGDDLRMVALTVVLE